jgi:hypothetical protein
MSSLSFRSRHSSDADADVGNINPDKINPDKTNPDKMKTIICGEKILIMAVS